jgi:pyruvate-formate lyase
MNINLLNPLTHLALRMMALQFNLRPSLKKQMKSHDGWTNLVNSDVLKDAMANPEKYRNLLVRISGYNAYFVHLNRKMQLELTERTEYGL